jgi:hypothetical protein
LEENRLTSERLGEDEDQAFRRNRDVGMDLPWSDPDRASTEPVSPDDDKAPAQRVIRFDFDPDLDQDGIHNFGRVFEVDPKRKAWLKNVLRHHICKLALLR